MQIAIIASRKDPAGMNIKECLSKHNLGANAAVHEIDEDSIHCEDIDKKIPADIFIFATRHQSSSGTPSLSCHSPGNWGIAGAGGISKQLCIAPALLLKAVFLRLNSCKEILHHEITLEVTHHGPYLEKPAIFIEIGSDEQNWKSREAGKAIASVIAGLANDIGRIMKGGYDVGFGIGGTHYCSSFNKIVQRTNIALGHICPKHMLEGLDKELIVQAMRKTMPEAKFAVLDWKGLGKEKARVISMLDELKIAYKRTDQILK